MAKLKVEVEVSKEAYELGQGLVKILGATKEALADGWQPGEDLAAVLAVAVAEFGAMVGGLDQLDDEAREDMAAFSKALGLSVADSVGVLLEKSEG